MLDHHMRAFVFVRDTEVVQKCIGRLTHDHGAKQLTTEPSTTACYLLDKS